MCHGPRTAAVIMEGSCNLFSQKPVGLSNHSFGTVFRNILGILNTLCFQFLCDLIIQLAAHQNQVSVLLTLAKNFSKSQVLGYS